LPLECYSSALKASIPSVYYYRHFTTVVPVASAVQ